MYNVLEHAKNYPKTFGCLFQYCKDILDDNDDIADIADNNTNDLFKCKEIVVGQAGDNRTKNVEIMVSLTWLSDLWKILKMLIINCKVNIMLNDN